MPHLALTHFPPARRPICPGLGRTDPMAMLDIMSQAKLAQGLT
jgi:hypothetical protein